MSAVSKHIEQRRLAQGLTQEDLAARLFVTPQTISDWETGKSPLDVDTLLHIAEALQTDAGALIYGSPAKPNRKKEVRKLCISAGLFALLGGAAWYLTPICRDLRSMQYIIAPNMLLHTLLLPLVFLLAGWTLMQSLGVLGVAKPFEQTRAKYVYFALLGLLALYALPALLFSADNVSDMLGYLHYRNNPSLYAGYSYDSFTPQFLFSFLWYFLNESSLFLLPGVLLWLTKPRKCQKKKKDTEVATASTKQ